MDAFIILGQIPGTDYYLTFTDMVAGYAASAFLWLAFVKYRSIKAGLLAVEQAQFKSKLS